MLEPGPIHYAALGVTLGFTVIGQLAFKKGSRADRSLVSALFSPYVIAACFSFLMVTIAAVVALQRLDLNFTTAWSGTAYFIVMVCSSRLFGERVTRSQWLGGGLIVLGLGIYCLG